MTRNEWVTLVGTQKAQMPQGKCQTVKTTIRRFQMETRTLLGTRSHSHYFPLKKKKKGLHYTLALEDLTVAELKSK